MLNFEDKSMSGTKAKHVLREGAPLVNELNTYKMAEPDEVVERPAKINPMLNLMHAIGQFHTGRRYTFEELAPDAEHAFSQHSKLIASLLSDAPVTVPK